MKLKNLVASIGLAITAVAAPRAFAANGNIYDIRPCDELGQVLDKPVHADGSEVTRDKPLYGGETVRFLVRLGRNSETSNKWRLHYLGVTNDWQYYLCPYQIGVFVSGAIKPASCIGTGSFAPSENFTDLIFEYKVEPGDLALPVVLANSAGKPASDQFVTDLPYYTAFMNNGKWQIDDSLEDKEGDDKKKDTWTRANLWFGTPPYPHGGGESAQDYDLRGAGFYVSTLDLGANSPEGSPYWRSVHAESSTPTGTAPVLTVKGEPTSAQKIYLWSEDDTKFYVADKDGKFVTRTVHVSATQTREIHVAEIKIESGVSSYKFTIFAKTEGAVTNLVMSGFCDFNYASSNERIKDYVTVPVACVEPLPPNVTVKATTSSIDVGPNFKTPATELEVTVSGATYDVNGECKVTITPKSQSTAIADVYKYVHINDSTGSDLDYAKSGPLELTFKKDESKTKMVYVYGLGADGETSILGKAIEFNPSADTAYGFEKFNSAAIYFMPTKPAFTCETKTITVSGGVAYEFGDLKVADCYKNLTDTETGYTIKYRLKEGDAETTMLGKWQPDADGFLRKIGDDGKLTTTKPSITYVVPTEDGKPYLTKITVTAPNQQPSAEAVEVTVTVKPPATAQIKVLSTNDVDYVTTGKFDESDESPVTFKVFLSEGNSRTQPIYAYLVPLFTTTNSVIIDAGSVFTNAENAAGVMIMPGETESDAGVFYLSDGTRTGTSLKFGVVLCESEIFNATKIIDTYQSKTLTITSLNVEPELTELKMEGAAGVSETGKEMGSVAVGVEKKFTFHILEPGLVDLKLMSSADYVSCEVREEAGPSDTPAITRTSNESQDFTFNYRFQALGKATIEITYKDKDIKSSKKFTATVNVTDQPQIEVVPETEAAVYETDEGGPGCGPMVLRFSDLKIPTVLEPITAKVQVVANVLNPENYTEKQLGTLKLGGLDPWRDENGKVVPDTYLAVFDKKSSIKIYVDSADGTKISASKGFTIKSEVVNTSSNSVSKSAWKDYYLKGETTFLVLNNAPLVVNTYPADQSVSTNVLSASIGENVSIVYAISDILPDLTNGCTVLVRATENADQTFTVTNTAEQTFTVKFKTSGDKQITLRAGDKDTSPQDETVVLWLYNVESAKVLVTAAHGPGTGIGSTASTLYSNRAKGLGAGYIYVPGVAFSAAEMYKISWNCGESKSGVNVYGWGYKTNAVDNGYLVYGYNNATVKRFQSDIPLDQHGYNTTEGGMHDLTTYYSYANDTAHGDTKRESFLYGWIVKTLGSSSGGSGSESEEIAISPEKCGSDSTKLVSLPTQSASGSTTTTSSSKTASYDETYVEGVFAKELLPSDNMGDINADGVPDLYAVMFGFISSSSDSETGDNDDLQDVNFGEDGEPYCVDYLPTTERTMIGRYIPGLKDTWVTTGKAFTPRLKIRGFDEDDAQAIAKRGTAYSALNDIGKWYSVGANPDRIYTNPREDEFSTLNYVEWLAWSEFKAGYEAEHGAGTATVDMWSPERPTDPTLADTDGDGMTDGYEYYFWYQAHVGYIENGVHKRLTGHRFDPRNPGRGILITSDEIAAAMDPQSGTSFKLRDSDCDGLPDLVEFEIGTNPFEFDTDGDGLPDGYELMYGGTDPLVPSTSSASTDRARNYDGDAMAFTSPVLEQNVLPKPLNIATFTTFALVDADGDSDGVQWYAVKDPAAVEFDTKTVSAWSFKVAGEDFASTVKPVVEGGVLMASLDRDVTFKATVELVPDENDPAVTNVVCTCGLPVRLPAGLTGVSDVSATALDCVVNVLKADVKVGAISTAWVYGAPAERSTGLYELPEKSAKEADYGFLALGRYNDKVLKAGTAVAVAASTDYDVAYLHHFVYQEFGFDARTAWSYTTPLAARWGKSTESGSDSGSAASANMYAVAAGYAGVATRTRPFAAYDEFLLHSYFVNNGFGGSWKTLSGTTGGTVTYTIDLANAWANYTTNPRGPAEPAIDSDYSEHFVGRYTIGSETTDAGEGEGNLNGADTDADGVPDGWELYVMAGKKNAKTGQYTFADRDALMSPFNQRATDTLTDTDADLDDLNEIREFAGTDSCAYYSEIQDNQKVAYSTTIARPECDAKWLNKFFPTDPWGADTDGDGISDGSEIKGSAIGEVFRCANFLYGEPYDSGSRCIAGGGLNPCSIDTDADGLPDPWEAQFPGTFAGDVDMIDDADAGVTRNAQYGITNGMDGTVWDAYTLHRGCTMITDDEDSRGFIANRDYDRDGLENWQEYLVGTMRCWRYDDPDTPWTAIPEKAYYRNGEFNATNGVAYFGLESEGEFWYKTLVDKESGIYNPYLLTDMNVGAQYFSRVDKPFDPNYRDEGLLSAGADHTGGAYYYMYNKVAGKPIAAVWAEKLGRDPASETAQPYQYISCSPIEYDTDRDGMDDYYELFHGMNPLLGQAGVKIGDQRSYATEGACDVVYHAWGGADGGTTPVVAWISGSLDANYWTRQVKDQKYYRTGKAPRGTGYDFEYYPWLNGLATADPDGDDIRNQEEAIMPKLATTTWHHTDPTPLWMTDTSYSNSLTRLNYVLPTRFASIPVETSFEYGGTNYYFRDFAGITSDGKALGIINPDQWYLAGKSAANWMFSFEENEGYDSDHDGISDYEEVNGRFRSATEPQDADSPTRRQAMYFSGWDAAKQRGSVLQSLPVVKERYPVGATVYPDDLAFLTYTVECWAKPESLADSTVLERDIWTGESAAGDREFLRRNFQIAIRNGKWYTRYDSSGTLEYSCTEVIGCDAETKWTHLAATYDGKTLRLYVNGIQQTPTASWVQPEYGASALGLWRDKTYSHAYGDLMFANDYSYAAFVVGASVKGSIEMGTDGKEALDLCRGEKANWNNYRDFFKGYVDEIRIWDGARDGDSIRADKDVRYTQAMALENRSSFYAQWKNGARRYGKDENGDDYTVVPELRCHYHFDSLFGAVDEKSVATAPHGFDYYTPPEAGSLADGKAYLSRPEGYTVDWLVSILARYTGTVYSNPAWVTWIPNTVTHMPRYDGTTLDSCFWSSTYAGCDKGTFSFQRAAEPVSRWTQMVRNGIGEYNMFYQTTAMRHYLTNLDPAVGSNSTQSVQFDFTGRYLNQQGDDLLPLGGAYVKYCDKLWDGYDAASDVWETWTSDANNDGLPDDWVEYCIQNHLKGIEPQPAAITWSTTVNYYGVRMTAGEAFQRDLAKGVVNSEFGADLRPEFAQTVDTTGSGIPDWWEKIYKIDGEAKYVDTDNDGLNNRVEYLVSEVYTNFNVRLNPAMPSTDKTTLDYFVRPSFGKLYLGEMFSDYDQIEDHWERAINDITTVDPIAWDALGDKDEDGWTNFAENRYNGYSMSTLPQLVSHLVGDAEVLDAPAPTVRLTVRYNGKRTLSAEQAEEGGQQPEQKKDGGSTDDSSDITIGTSARAGLVVETYTDDAMEAPDAVYNLKPGTTVTKAVYMGGWEDRVVRGTMGPGHIDIGGVNLKFAQVPQSDLYSWTDENGQHLARPYSEFKEALERNPEILQNLQDFKWLELVTPVNEYTSSDRAVTVVRDADKQKGYIAVYGQRVGTIDLETGDFVFNMKAMIDLAINYTYDAAKGKEAAWSYKEAIFKLTYSATVPSVQQKRYQVSLARPDSGFVKGGANSIMAYYDLDGDGYTPGVDPMGVLRGVDVGWGTAEAEIELTTMNAISPRIDLWGTTSDRGERTEAASDDENKNGGGADEEVAVSADGLVRASASAKETRVRVIRYQVDNIDPFMAGVSEPTVLVDRVFQSDVRNVLHEGDFLTADTFDIDWDRLYDEVVTSIGVIATGTPITNVNYLVVFGDDSLDLDHVTSTNANLSAHPVLVSRRFEKNRTAPTAVQDSMIRYTARPTFSWKIDNEESWACRYGTTYTAFKVKVFDSANRTVYDSGYQRMPAVDSTGVYSWTAPLFVDMPSPSGDHLVFSNLCNYTWQVFTYNSKFKNDKLGSEKLPLRMSVSSELGNTYEIPVRVCYNGPATKLDKRVHVQAFTSPDFAGVPAAEVILTNVEASAIAPDATGAKNAVLKGLVAGTYFLRAYIDTDNDYAHADWESWGYLSERDLASVGGTKGIFNPVGIEVGADTAVTDVRQLFIEDADTNGNSYPDVWEAEQNGNVFDRDLIAPATGDTAWTRVNPLLKDNVTSTEFPMLAALGTTKGLSLMSGLSLKGISETATGLAVEPTLVDETLTITGIELKADEGKVLVKVAAEVEAASINPTLAEMYAVTVKKGATVMVKVLHTDTLAGNWNEVASVPVAVDEIGTDIEAKLGETLPSSGFFKVVVEQ